MNPKPLKITVLQGPNLNMLGQREPEVYGAFTLEQIHDDLNHTAGSQAVTLDFFQSNHEGELIDRVQQSGPAGVHGLIINAGSFTHTSIGLRDALKGSGLPFIEVHISNVHARESFRAHSYLSDIAAGVVLGFGVIGYRLALLGLIERLRPTRLSDPS